MRLIKNTTELILNLKNLTSLFLLFLKLIFTSRFVKNLIALHYFIIITKER